MTVIPAGSIAARLTLADGGNTAQKGAELEVVVKETFCLLDGVGVIKTNAVDVQQTAEIDILLYNLRHPAGLPFLPDPILIECKNWAAPVDSATVRSFTSKLQQFGLKFGILVAANGITGDNTERQNAQGLLKTEFDRHNQIILVLRRTELESLASSEELGMMLRDKYGSFIMGLPSF